MASLPPAAGAWSPLRDGLLGALTVVVVAALVIATVRSGFPPSRDWLPLIGGASVILILCLGTFVSPASWRTRMVLVVTSVVITLYALEFALSFLLHPSAGNIRPTTGTRPGRAEAVASTSVAGAIRQLRLRGESIYPIVRGGAKSNHLIRVDGNAVLPLSPGIANSTALLCNEGEGFVRAQYDERGFRNPVGGWDVDSVEVVVIGDSFAEGYCVAWETSVPARLRAVWRRTLNLGTAGAGPLHELAVLQEYGAALRPSTVLWLYYEGNDFGDLAAERRRPELHRYLTAGHRQDLVRYQQAIDDHTRRLADSLLYDAKSTLWPTKAIRDWKRRLPAALKLRTVRHSIGLGLRVPPPAASVRMLDRILHEAQATVRSWNGDLYLVYLPAYRRYATWLGDFGSGRREVLAIARQRGIPTIDLVEALQRDPPAQRLWPQTSGHYGVEGYHFVADRILAALNAAAARRAPLPEPPSPRPHPPSEDTVQSFP